MTMRTLLLAVALLSASAVAGANDPATPATPAAPAADAAPATPEAKPKLICRSDAGTGTRLRRSAPVCMTAEDWQDLREASRQKMDEMSRATKAQTHE
jgi:hypothetical protein